MKSLNKTHRAVEGGDRKPFFSVITPVFNAARYLREFLESLQLQDFQDWEAVLVDDASSDSSAAIIEEFSRNDTRIRLFRSERNSGSAYAPRMRAANNASGLYVVTIDADDLISTDYLRKIHQRIMDAGTDLVLTEMWRLTGKESYRILPIDTIDRSIVLTGKHLVAHTLCIWEISMNGFAIRRNLYIAADGNLTPEDKKSIFADELLSRWLLHMSGSVSFCDATYHYRQNDTSVTHVNLQRYIDGRMLTSDGIISMVRQTFGENSEVFIRALENKLYSAVDLLRLINASGLDRHQKASAVSRISSGMKGFRLSMLKGKTSPRYLALMRLPLPLAGKALLIIDRLIKK